MTDTSAREESSRCSTSDYRDDDSPPLTPEVIYGWTLEGPEAKQQKLTFKEIISDYARRTTLHGYVYLAKPTPWRLRRVLWALYIAVCSAFFVFYAASQVALFLKFRKNSFVEVEFRNSVKFPAITICNQNSFKLSSSIEAGWYEIARLLSSSGTDGKSNNSKSCLGAQYRCTEDGSCIDRSRLCDAFPDCENGSDEMACERCPLIYLEVTGIDISAAFSRRQYLYHGELINGGRQLYITIREPFIYLDFDAGTWYLSDSLTRRTVYAKITSSESVPERLGRQLWSVNKSNNWESVTVNVMCDINFKEFVNKTKPQIDGHVNMFMLYNETAHREEDFIRRCVWKGKPCVDVGNVTSVMTDIGLCHMLTFEESTMEHAGAGYGLSMTLNIEQYEYVKSAGDGVGIKLLLHEPSLYPKMRHDGQTVPPGMVSYIAMETTTVTSIPKPWGNCGEFPLEYFVDYSKSRCVVECEMKSVVGKCGCRVFYMPHKQGEPKVCDVETFNSCAAPQLEKIHAPNSGFCEHCTERCTRDTVVTTTSFALMLANLGDEQDERRYTLKKKLTKARELRYRSLTSNYKATMRTFHLMDQHLAQLEMLLDIMDWKMKANYDDITTYVMLVMEDCKRSRNMLRRANCILDTEIIKPLDQFKTDMYRVLVKYLSSLDTLTDGLIKEIQDARTNHALGSNPLIIDFGTCSPDCRNTMEGLDYTGNRSTTVSGLTCQRWDQQSPHKHPYTAIFDDRFAEGNIVDAANFCRNPDKESTGPWCYTTDPDVERETCVIPICSDCKNVGEPYIGNRQLTLSGRTCQRWDSQYPHQHEYTNPEQFPDASLSEAANFCRNPDNKVTGPWCYTTDPDVTWETCAIPMCHDCKMKSLGTDYVGTKSVTRTGRACQRWDMQYPHKHTYTDIKQFPDHTLADASNFCRNPDRKEVGPWCFTTDPGRRWEPCDIPFCSKCKLHDDDRGVHYDGSQSFTIFGRACQRWDSQSPHRHNYTEDDMFPDRSISAASNFCRNPDPDSHSAPWCYTTHPDFEWEPCDISLCNDCSVTREGSTYIGNRATTISNRPCQRWDRQYPHRHPYSDPAYFPDKTLFEANNFCRNPDNSVGGPWCYTTDPEVEKEVCGVPKCSTCRMEDKGMLYKGIKKMTKSGRVCQRWDSQIPHAHPAFPMDNFPDATLLEAANYCRNPDMKLGVGPWCYTNDADVPWESCDIPYCYLKSADPRDELDCIHTEIGTEYTGTWSRTATGRACQRWDSQYPHKHTMTDPELFPDDQVTLAKNYCRNPDRKRGVGPWCFTTDPDVVWESCGLPMCFECIKNDQPYQGTRYVTQSGLICQRWDAQLPHPHPYQDTDFPENNTHTADNFCRNPNNLPSGPWCYTVMTDRKSESCGIKPCAWPECRITNIGSEYRGRRSVTMSGIRCQRWDLQEPHSHPYTDPGQFPDPSIAEAANYCRNPDNRAATGPWCYTTDPDIEWQPCEIPRCSDCKRTLRGVDYIGHQTVTMSGRACQSWARQVPHAHSFTNGDVFPEKSVDAASNYCRNPDQRQEGPWCYTQDPGVEWEPCGILDCESTKYPECRTSYYGDDYQGQKSVTLSGRLCQYWASQYPHAHNHLDDDFPDGSLKNASNYCRNPDKRSGDGPWCYTTDPNVNWEFCGIPFCFRQGYLNTRSGLEYKGVRSVTRYGTPCQHWNKQTPHPHQFTDPAAFPEETILDAQNYCRNPDGRSSGPWCYTIDPTIVSESCGISMATDCRLTDRGLEYTGHQSITVSGRTCQRWLSQSPHKHNFADAESFPDYSLEDADNFCRNPDNSAEGPWCYTTDPDTRREQCDVPKCNECKESHLGTEYIGHRYYTVSGRICQRWDEQAPHQHKFSDEHFPDDSIAAANNYCRNPDKDPEGPWCLTIDPGVRREQCGIRLCVKPGCRLTEIGNTYRGQHIFTASGRLCQRWDKQQPHRHDYTNATLFPDTSLSDASNYCRNPDDDPEGPWCYTVDPDVERETCNIPMCSDCVEDLTSRDYAGRRSITASGRVCQRWNSQFPHVHSTRVDDLPDASLDDAANYCRNPDNRSTGPWCYTLDIDMISETCDIPLCTDCRITYHGYDYKGRISTTISGRPCQRWDQQVPHPHPMTDVSFFPDKTLSDANNFCRNPDRKYGVGPWCITADPDLLWEPCGVPLCKDCTMDKTGTAYTGRRSTTIKGTTCQRWDQVNITYHSTDFDVTSLSVLANYCRNPKVGTKIGTGPWCHSEETNEIISCGIKLCSDCRQSGEEYIGIRSKTLSGKRCQRWDTMSPNRHVFTSGGSFPDASVKNASNYCRNPNNTMDGPWCYLAEDIGSESCGIPYCTSTDCTWSFTGDEYRGHYALTVTARSCRMWSDISSTKEDSVTFTDDHFPEQSIDEAYNFCRNPNASKSGPWCYTTDPRVEWEYCPIPSCQDCHKPGEPYLGKRAFTISGIPCQRWDQQLPHKHEWKDVNFSGDGSIHNASNYCRSPDGATIPWCYTLNPDIRREKCYVRSCEDCFRKRYGTDYEGTIDATLSGRKCQSWTSNQPHNHTFNKAYLFADPDIDAASNFCRNPHQEDTGRIRPWCLTTDQQVEWEYCNVPQCDGAGRDGCDTLVPNRESTSFVKTTLYGKPCDSWNKYPPVLGRYYRLRGHIRSGEFYFDNGTISTHRGEVVNGTCYLVERNYSVQGSCNHTDWFYSSTGQCDIGCNLPYGCVNLKADCGIDPDTGDVIKSCCDTVTQTCRADNWVSSTCLLDQYDDQKDKELCCGEVCCLLNHTDSNQWCYNSNKTVYCSLDNATSILFHAYKADTKRCCYDTCCDNVVYKDGIYVNDVYLKAPFQTASCCSLLNETCCRLSHSTPECCINGTETITSIPEYRCQVIECVRDVKTCYNYINMINWYVDFSLKKVYDSARHVRSEYFVNCDLTLLEDVSIYPDSEPLVFNKPTNSRNYCRNPDGNTDRGLWCYTADPYTKRQWCDLPFCPGVLPETETPAFIPPLPALPQINWTVPRTSSAVVYTKEYKEAETSTETDITSESTLFPTEPPTTPSAETNTDRVIGPRTWIPRRCDYHLYRTITRYNQTIWNVANNLILSIEHLSKPSGGSFDERAYIVNKTMFDGIAATIGNCCTWCVESSASSSLINRTSARIDQWQKTTFDDVAVRVGEELKLAISRYFSKSWVQEVGSPVITDDVIELKDSIRRASDTIKDSLRKTDVMLDEVRQASKLTSNFHDHNWKLECDRYLSKLLSEYDNFDKTITSVLKHFRIYLNKTRSRNQRCMDAYISGEMSLEEVTNLLGFHDFSLQLQAAWMEIDDHMTHGRLLTNMIYNQINEIFYTMLSYTDANDLASNSIYWRYMNMSSVSVKMPDLIDFGGILLPVSVYGIVHEGVAATKWQDKLDIISDLSTELESKLRNIVKTMTGARNYFEGYVKGNQIDEHFFANNFLSIEVFSQDMSVRKIIETREYDYANLLSDIGGTMGLLLGASVITIGELLDLLMYALCTSCKT